MQMRHASKSRRRGPVPVGARSIIRIFLLALCLPAARGGAISYFFGTDICSGLPQSEDCSHQCQKQQRGADEAIATAEADAAAAHVAKDAAAAATEKARADLEAAGTRATVAEAKTAAAERKAERNAAVARAAAETVKNDHAAALERAGAATAAAAAAAKKDKEAATASAAQDQAAAVVAAKSEVAAKAKIDQDVAVAAAVAVTETAAADHAASAARHAKVDAETRAAAAAVQAERSEQAAVAAARAEEEAKAEVEAERLRRQLEVGVETVLHQEDTSFLDRIGSGIRSLFFEPATSPMTATTKMTKLLHEVDNQRAKAQAELLLECSAHDGTRVELGSQTAAFHNCSNDLKMCRSESVACSAENVKADWQIHMLIVLLLAGGAITYKNLPGAQQPAQGRQDAAGVLTAYTATEHFVSFPVRAACLCQMQLLNTSLFVLPFYHCMLAIVWTASSQKHCMVLLMVLWCLTQMARTNRILMFADERGGNGGRYTSILREAIARAGGRNLVVLIHGEAVDECRSSAEVQRLLLHVRNSTAPELRASVDSMRAQWSQHGVTEDVGQLGAWAVEGCPALADMSPLRRFEGPRCLRTPSAQCARPVAPDAGASCMHTTGGPLDAADDAQIAAGMNASLYM